MLGVPGRLTACLAAVTAASSVYAAQALATQLEQYPTSQPEVFVPGQSYASQFDNCYYHEAYATRNAMFKNQNKFGRSVFILTNGSWVNGVEDNTIQTNSYANGPSGNFTNNQKKGYMKNTDSTSYIASGYLDGGLRSDCGNPV